MLLTCSNPDIDFVGYMSGTPWYLSMTFIYLIALCQGYLDIAKKCVCAVYDVKMILYAGPGLC